MHILLVEDDDGDAKAIIRALEKARIDHPLVRAVDGIEALGMLRGENGCKPVPRPYVVLVDLNLPRMDGTSLIREIRADVALRQSVVFVLTTSNRDEDRVAAYDLNVAGYVLKDRAGQDFQRITDLLVAYERIVELPR